MCEAISSYHVIESFNLSDDIPWKRAASFSKDIRSAVPKTCETISALRLLFGNFEGFLKGNFSKKRDGSLALSNLGMLKIDTASEESERSIGSTYFVEDDAIVGSAIRLNAVGGPEGSINLTVTWSTSCLDDRVAEHFAEELGRSLLKMTSPYINSLGTWLIAHSSSTPKNHQSIIQWRNASHPLWPKSTYHGDFKWLDLMMPAACSAIAYAAAINNPLVRCMVQKVYMISNLAYVLLYGAGWYSNRPLECFSCHGRRALGLPHHSASVVTCLKYQPYLKAQVSILISTPTEYDTGYLTESRGQMILNKILQFFSSFTLRSWTDFFRW